EESKKAEVETTPEATSKTKEEPAQINEVKVEESVAIEKPRKRTRLTKTAQPVIDSKPRKQDEQQRRTSVKADLFSDRPTRSEQDSKIDNSKPQRPERTERFERIERRPASSPSNTSNGNKSETQSQASTPNVPNIDFDNVIANEACWKSCPMATVF